MSRYREAVDKLVHSGNPEAAAKTALAASSDLSLEVDRNSEITSLLIRARIAIKNSILDFDLSSLDPSRTADLFLKAEIHFVRGLFQINTAQNNQEYLHTETSFVLASEFYKAAGDPKWLLARYNAWIARDNLNDGQNSLFERLKELHLLERLTAEEKNQRVLAMVLRQKSYLYFENSLFEAALEFALEALAIFEINGPESDYHLILIHAADCHFAEGDVTSAKRKLSLVPHRVDARVEFPLSYVRSRVENSIVKPEDFKVVSEYWRKRFELSRSLARSSDRTGVVSGAPSGTQMGNRAEALVENASWSFESGWLLNGAQQRVTKIKPNSLEGKLISILGQHPESKSVLISALWPDFTNARDLDLRFHQLLKRVNQKIENRLTYDGSKYVLSFKLKS